MDTIAEKTLMLPPISLEQMSGIKLMNRTDTKFVATIQQLYMFLHAVLGKYFIQEINGKRIASYHTTYFDTEDYKMYHMHHAGRCVREKIRVRTYLDSQVTFFEIKNKNNHGRTKKKRVAISSLEALGQEHETVTPLLKKHAWYSIGEITPAIENRFNRITLVNYDKTERLTIDFNMQFHHLRSNGTDKLQKVAVIELKRDGNVPSPALDIIKSVRIKRSGFSKYCIGTALTNNSLKKNNFKERLIMINKMEHKR